MEQVTGMLENLHVQPNQSQQRRFSFSGGEPTIRKEFSDMIRKAKEVGFNHVEVNTNGLRIAQDLEYC